MKITEAIKILEDNNTLENTNMFFSLSDKEEEAVRKLLMVASTLSYLISDN